MVGESDKNPLVSQHWYSIFSREYKSSVIDNSIRRAFGPSLGREEDYTDPKYPAWTAPPIVRTFTTALFFKLYDLPFRRAAPLLFQNLRTKYWNISEEDYAEEFDKPLEPVSGLGFSGSLFFFTKDKSYIVKSVGRKFEYTFLYTQCLDAYGKYCQENNDTILSRITDVLFCFDRHIGGILNITPSHYVVMENVLKGMDHEKGWTKWDLKPQQFFEPTRDLIPDKIKTEAAKTGLADAMEEDRIIITQKQKHDLWAILEKDTEFLEKIETIDYSLLLGRYTVEDNGKPPQPEHWLTGVTSADGKYVYRASIVDFLWNVNQLQAKLTRVAGIIMPEQTVTTEPGRYRKEFMKMVEEYVEVPSESEPSGSHLTI